MLSIRWRRCLWPCGWCLPCPWCLASGIHQFLGRRTRWLLCVGIYACTGRGLGWTPIGWECRPCGALSWVRGWNSRTPSGTQWFWVRLDGIDDIDDDWGYVVLLVEDFTCLGAKAAALLVPWIGTTDVGGVKEKSLVSCFFMAKIWANVRWGKDKLW